MVGVTKMIDSSCFLILALEKEGINKNSKLLRNKKLTAVEEKKMLTVNL